VSKEIYNFKQCSIKGVQIKQWEFVRYYVKMALMDMSNITTLTWLTKTELFIIIIAYFKVLLLVSSNKVANDILSLLLVVEISCS